MEWAVHPSNPPVPVADRLAQIEDFDFCARLYFAGMETVIRDLKLDMAAQTENLRQRWSVTEVQIIVRWRRRGLAAERTTGKRAVS
jgi:hypothetical protein